MHRSLMAVTLGLVALVAGCEASYPTRPDTPTPVALQVHYLRPVGYAAVRSSYTFAAYVLRSDGAWENVTTRAAWSAPDPAVLRSSGFGVFLADAPGASGVRVEYGGLATFVDMFVIDPSVQPYPRLTIAPGTPVVIGASSQATASFQSAAGAAAQAVTADAIWTSSDPAVATVAAGRVTAVGPGTTRITATFQGVSNFYGWSVPPPAQ